MLKPVGRGGVCSLAVAWQRGGALSVAIALALAARAVAVDGLEPGPTSAGSRFTACDRGEPIGYLVDVQTLPDAFASTNEALAVVSNALSAWADISSASFRFDGMRDFGVSSAAACSNAADGRLYIQLHDLYDIVPDLPTTWYAQWGRLCMGGIPVDFAGSSTNAVPGRGGRVGTNYFDLTQGGFISLEHTRSQFSEARSVEEILAHNVAHVLGVSHSASGTSIMKSTPYFDGRGARLDPWDTNSVQKIHPVSNRPPYDYDRILDVLYPPDLDVTNWPGLNGVQIDGWDLDGDTLTLLHVTNYIYLPPDTWKIDGKFVGYDVIDPPVFSGRFEPHTDAMAGGRMFVQLSDGINLSPIVQVRLTSYDGTNGFSYALPVQWAGVYHLTNTTFHPLTNGWTGDPDGDGADNITEWLHRTDPTNALSGYRVWQYDTNVLVWEAKSMGVYEIEKSTNLLEGFVPIRSMTALPYQSGSSNSTICATTVTVEQATSVYYRVRLKP